MESIIYSLNQTTNNLLLLLKKIPVDVPLAVLSRNYLLTRTYDIPECTRLGKRSEESFIGIYWSQKDVWIVLLNADPDGDYYRVEYLNKIPLKLDSSGDFLFKDNLTKWIKYRNPLIVVHEYSESGLKRKSLLNWELLQTIPIYRGQFCTQLTTLKDQKKSKTYDFKNNVVKIDIVNAFLGFYGDLDYAGFILQDDLPHTIEWIETFIYHHIEFRILRRFQGNSKYGYFEPFKADSIDNSFFFAHLLARTGFFRFPKIGYHFNDVSVEQNRVLEEELSKLYL